MANRKFSLDTTVVNKDYYYALLNLGEVAQNLSEDKALVRDLDEAVKNFEEVKQLVFSQYDEVDENLIDDEIMDLNIKTFAVTNETTVDDMIDLIKEMSKDFNITIIDDDDDFTSICSGETCEYCQSELAKEWQEFISAYDDDDKESEDNDDIFDVREDDNENYVQELIDELDTQLRKLSKKLKKVEKDVKKLLDIESINEVLEPDWYKKAVDGYVKGWKKNDYNS